MTASGRFLVSWIGHADLRAMAATLPAELRSAIEQVVGTATGVDRGPLKTLVDLEPFDEVWLLSNYDPCFGRQYVKWLGGKAELRQVSLGNPTDYGAIFKVVDAELAALFAHHGSRDTELCMHLSPGSPAMAAVWLLLGKTRYPATFYQTHAGRAWKTEIPFDVAVDFIPQFLSDADAHWLHLAASSPSEIKGFEQIVGDSQAIRLAVGRARRASVRSVPILILGESGTGKEMFARAIHNASPRHSKPFVAINCAAIPMTLLESELFGHKEGAFTGAVDRIGAFEQADGGTLFLDEVGECDAAMQGKLLRVLQPSVGGRASERVFCRVGESRERRSDVRVIAATNRDLVADMNAGRFREDLFYRLAVVSIMLPPLRERRSDIPPLAEHLLARINKDAWQEEPGYRNKTLTTQASEFIKRHDWPGNARQLHNALLQAAVMAEGDKIDRADLAAAIAHLPNRAAASILDQPLGGDFCLETHLEEIHRRYLRRAMIEAKGVKSRAAKLLGMANYQTLDAQLKRLKVDVPEFE